MKKWTSRITMWQHCAFQKWGWWHVEKKFHGEVDMKERRGVDRKNTITHLTGQKNKTDHSLFLAMLRCSWQPDFLLPSVSARRWRLPNFSDKNRCSSNLKARPNFHVSRVLHIAPRSSGLMARGRTPLRPWSDEMRLESWESAYAC